MASSSPQHTRVGILGGGQLGRMLIQAGIDLNVDFKVLDPDPQAPCHQLAEFSCGRLTDYETVMAFGQSCDLITIEIENVNTLALKHLEAAGKKIFPQPHIIELIQDKRTQKEFYRSNLIPTADFVLTENKAAVAQHRKFLPAVHKLGKEGYDGRGVQSIRSAEDLDKAFDAPGVLEKRIDFEKEIAVIVAQNESGDISTFPTVEMVFHPEANLVEYLLSPALLSPSILASADAIARDVAKKLGIVGILAVEMFVTKEGEILVNEVAPRPHNSGHQTIEANVTSQYHQLLRALLNLPLGSTDTIRPSAMVNLLGAEGFSGEARYEGLDAVLSVAGVYVHLYGKKQTKPFRKMGHVTIVDPDLESLKNKINFVKKTIRITA